MTVDQIREQLEPWLAKHRRPAWKPIVEEVDGPRTASKFGGTPWIRDNAPWPDCGCCDKPLQLFLQLDLGDLPEELGHRFGTGLLQLFYCTRDACQGNGGWEPFGDDLSRVRVIQPTGRTTPARQEGFLAKRIVGWERFLDLPTPQEHNELGLRYTYNFKAGTVTVECDELGLVFKKLPADGTAEDIANTQNGDKLAGWPAWIQGVEYPSCPRCRARMVHLFQFDSNDNVPFMFGDVGCGHITQCPEHQDVVAFGWACS